MSQVEAMNPFGHIEMSQNLRTSLERAMRYAVAHSHQRVTLEHLLLALLEDREAAVIVEASAVDMASIITEVSNFVDRIEDRHAVNERREPELGPDVQHIIRSAGAAAQKSSRRTVGSALVLAAIVGDGRSAAAQMLRNHGLTFEHAIAALKHVSQAAYSQAAASPTTAPPARPARPVDTSAQLPTPRPTSDANAPLQNVQAAHDIIAGARERIAAARSAIAARSPASPTPPAEQSSAQPAPSSDTLSQPAPQPAITPPPLGTPPHIATHHDRTFPPPSAPLVPPAPQRGALPPERAIMQPGPSVNGPAQPPRDAYRQPPQQPPQQVPHHPAPHQPPPMRPVPMQPLPLQPMPQRPTAPRGPLPPGYLQGHPAEQAHAEATAHTPRAQPAAAYTPPLQPYDPSAQAQPIEPRSLVASIPGRMCVGVPTTIEIRAPRAGLEAWSGANDPRAPAAEIIMKAMVMRLKAPAGGFTIESASPETQWSEGYIGPLSDDIVSWRWIVTPVASGTRPLQLAVLTRVVGRDRLAAVCALPEQTVTVRVSPHYGRIAARTAAVLLIAGVAGALGYFGESLLHMAQAILAR